MRLLSVGLLALSLTPAVAGSESLGSAARRERERRAKNEEAGIKPVRVITHDDVATKVGEPASAQASPTPVEKSSSTKPDDSAQRERDEAGWRSRAEAARRRLDSARERLAATPPTVPDGLPWTDQKGQWRSNITENPAYADLRLEIKAAEKAIADLEEQARRAGVPPGWLR